MVETFGRTNESVPSQWFRLRMPETEQEAEDLAHAAAQSGAILDLSPAPARWGHLLRRTDVRIAAFGSLEYESARDEHHAFDLTSAHLIQTLSAFGREQVDFLFLPVRRATEEFQINGALAALQTAKADGLILHVGLFAQGAALPVLTVWRFHDAFEAVLARRNPRFEADFAILAGLAKERRVGLVSCEPFDWGAGLSIAWRQGPHWDAAGYLAWLKQHHPVLLSVRSADELFAATSRAEATPIKDAQAALSDYDNLAKWQALLDDPRPWVSDAARRASLAAI